jgi:outer membrane receptor protein involved in Fe transport
VFAQIRSTPDLIPNAHLAAGVRYNEPSVGQSATVWNGSGRYDFSPFLFLRANVGTAFRLPTAEELFANDPDDERGDPNIKPETSTNANVSLGGTFTVGASPLKWEAISFWRAIKNLITFVSFDNATDQAVFGNAPGKVTMYGEELTLDASLSEALSVNFSATYNHARQDGEDFQFDQIPKSLFKAGLDYHPPGQRFGGTIELVNVGDVDDEPLGAGNGRYGYGNYTVLNLDGRVFLDPARRHRIDVHLNNVGNHVYYTQLGYGFNDDTGNPYVTHTLGLRRTFQANYSYTF